MSRSRPGSVEIVAVRTVLTPWGWAGLGASRRGMVRCTWPWPGAVQAERSLGVEGQTVVKPESKELLEQAAEWLLAFFFGSCHEMTKVPLDGRIFTGWQRKVYEIVTRIPFGEVRSYGWVAGECGKPGAARAAGQALARNPLPLFIPCHRVVYSDGRSGSYSCEGTALPGEELKRRLIEWERMARRQ